MVLVIGLGGVFVGGFVAGYLFADIIDLIKRDRGAS